MLNPAGTVRLVGDAEKLLSLLLLKHAHLVLEHLSMDETLTFVFDTLQLNTLSIRNGVGGRRDKVLGRATYCGHVGHITS